MKKTFTGVSNITLKDGKVVPTYKNGFEVVASVAKSGNWLPLLDAIRTWFRNGGRVPVMKSI